MNQVTASSSGTLKEKTLAQIAAEYEVHPMQLKNWRAVA
jgi:transposase-like protein